MRSARQYLGRIARRSVRQNVRSNAAIILLDRRESESFSRPIVHIEQAADIDRTAFEMFTPQRVEDLPQPTLGTREAYVAPDGAVETGTWEATPGTFSRAIVDAEF